MQHKAMTKTQNMAHSTQSQEPASVAWMEKFSEFYLLLQVMRAYICQPTLAWRDKKISLYYVKSPTIPNSLINNARARFFIYLTCQKVGTTVKVAGPRPTLIAGPKVIFLLGQTPSIAKNTATAASPCAQKTLLATHWGVKAVGCLAGQEPILFQNTSDKANKEQYIDIRHLGQWTFSKKMQ